MTNHNSPNTNPSNDSKVSADGPLVEHRELKVREDHQTDCLPCSGAPLIGAVCGCGSPAKIISALSLPGACPFGRPWGCPLRLPPYL